MKKRCYFTIIYIIIYKYNYGIRGLLKWKLQIKFIGEDVSIFILGSVYTSNYLHCMMIGVNKPVGNRSYCLW